MNRLALASAFVLGGTLAVSANTLTFKLNQTFGDGTIPDKPYPAGSPPWVTLVFDDHGGSGSVTMTASANLQSTTEFISDIFFNSTVDPTDIAVSGGWAGMSIERGPSNSTKADGDGKYDFRFMLPTAGSGDRFDGTESFSVTLTGAGITALTFNDLSLSTGGLGPYQAAVHVQALSGGASTWLYPGTSVPDGGATAALLGLGMLGLGLLRLRE